MRRLISYALTAGAVVALVPALAGAQAGGTVNLEQLMSPEERAATGIARLTPAERATLEAWLARYTATVTTVVRGMQPGAVQSAPVTAPQTVAPRAAEPQQVPQARVLPQPLPLPRTAPNGAQIFRSADGGTFIQLDDGTMWEIYFSDRPKAAAWRVGDFVSVRPRAARVGEFTYQLVNANATMRDRGRVTARYAGYIRVEEPGTGGENR